MNRTIYVAPEDMEVWRDAVALAKARRIGMGRLIIEALKLFVRPQFRTSNEEQADGRFVR